jgi:N-formylglutamate amidohydrolase
LVVCALALALALACGGGATPSAPASPSVPASLGVAGDVRADAAGWVQYTIGNAPLMITAPHGGSLAPASLQDRTCVGCVTVTDDNTEDLARRVVAQFLARTGKRPHLVINLLKRAKFDPNRDVAEATGGNALLTPSWAAFHAFVDTSSARIAAAQGRGLLLDLHGHGHTIPRLELGYMISAADLQLSDASLAASGAVGASSIARLATVAVDHPSSAVLLRGATSLGALLVRNGFPSVPSPSDVAPAAGDEYFTGGYITERHGSATGGAVDAIQIEANRPGARDTPENLDKYAAALVSSALEYLGVHYGWTPTLQAFVAARMVRAATVAR